ncbi:MAG: HTTM domain-containing protein [Saprospiraceae bacterium]
MKTKLNSLLFRSTSIAPLITFRILFGGLMLVGALRFMHLGWVERLYVAPRVFFKFYGFEWVENFGERGMYLLYSLIALSAAFIMVGLFYRLAAILFFLSFTYAELIDSTNYLNHYYLVCLLAFLLIFLPAHRAYSVDVWRKPAWQLQRVPAWTINVIIFQISIVYVCAGIAKLSSDWLLRAMPLAIWLPTKANWPLLGPLFAHSWTAYAFSWAGALYDLTIPFFLLHPRTRPFAYIAVIGFHVLTKLLFNIGLFPFIMIFNTLIFFSGAWHERFLMVGKLGSRKLGGESWEIEKLGNLKWDSLGVRWSKSPNVQPWRLLTSNQPPSRPQLPTSNPQPATIWFSAFDFRLTIGHNLVHYLQKKLILIALTLYFSLQVFLPFRYLFYPGYLLWTEEGYRFSWRVMLVEKVGQATFYIHDLENGRKSEVDNSKYLSLFQEKQMVIQPDMILQYAHFLAKTYEEEQGICQPKVTVNSHVALNGRRSQAFVNPNIDLAAIKDGWAPKHWIIPFRHE